MTLYRPLKLEVAAEQISLAVHFLSLLERRLEVLEEELSRSRLVLDSVGSGITISNAAQPDLPLVYVNQSFQEMTGYNRAESYGLNCRFLQGTDYNQPGLVAVRAGIRNQVAIRAVLRNYRKDGSGFWNELHLSPIRGRSGEVTFFVGIQHDVTAQVEAGMRIDLLEDYVVEGQRKLKTIINQMKDAIVGLNQNGEVVHANKQALALCDVEEGEENIASLLDCIDVFQPDGAVLPREEWPGFRALRGDFVQRTTVRIRNKTSGVSKLCEVSTAPVLNLAGEVDLVLVTFHDITEQVRLEQQRSMLAAIVESSQDAIIGTDLGGLVTSWNDSARRMFGYSPQEMLGAPIVRLIPPGDHAQMLEFRKKILAGETIEQADLSRTSKDGSTVNISVTLSPIRDEKGRIIGASRVVREITAKKQMERHLQQSHKMEALGQLTGGVAHDFNNILAIIMGNLELVEASVTGDALTVRRLHAAQKATNRGAELTRRLLTLSSSDELAPKPVLLNETITAMLDLIANSAGSTIRVVSHLNPTIRSVFVDAAGLESAILQIVANARDAMPQGGTLIVTTEPATIDQGDRALPELADLLPGNYAKVSISDTGHGMSRDVLDHAFEPFYTTKDSHKGSGLGLSMVFGFVTQSGGAIHLYSEKGFGTTLTFYLPLTKERGLAEDSTSSAPKMQSAGAVLIVDDQPDLLDIAAAYLEEMGCRVYQATGSSAALALAGQHPELELLLTDVVMPGDIGGVELAAKILQIRPEIKVVYCSGFTAASLAEKSAGLTGSPLLQKPYQRIQFRAIVQQAMGREEHPQ